MNNADRVVYWLYELDRDLYAHAKANTAQDRWGRRFCIRWDRRELAAAIKRLRGVAK